MEFYISIFSAILALLATFVSVWTLFETRRVSKLIVNLEMLEFGNEILLENPEVLRLHGITIENLKECGLTIQDFMYLLNSLYAGQSYFVISNNKKVTISKYRQTMMVQPGVEKAWKELIRGRLIAESPYARAIDEFYATKKESHR